MKYIFYLTVVYLSYTCFGSIDLYSDLKSKIENNYYIFDAKIHQNLITEIKSHQNSISKSQFLYLLSFEEHTLGKIVYNSDPDKALELFDSSISNLQQLIEIDKQAEYLALLSSSLGKKASLSTLTAVYWGMRSKNRFFESYELDSNNRKVLLVASIHLMHLPSVYGGDKNKAERLLRKCLKIQENDANAIIWAKDEEIYAYLAQLEILKKNKNLAQFYISKAIELKKDYGFVIFDLIPQLKEIK